MTQSNSLPAAPIDLRDLAQFPEFCREAERLKLATRQQLQWWVRFRHENGLVSSGALIERAINPRSKRPLLFVHRPRFAAWLAGHQTAA